MKIIFRIIHHPLDSRGVCAETFNYAPAVEADGVSATANSAAFSPIMRICSELKYDRVMVKRATKRVNRAKKIAILRGVQPKLFLVPKTNGISSAEELSDDLMSAISSERVVNLNFTHYGFIKHQLPVSEIAEVLYAMKKWKNESSLQSVIWDIDRRYVEDMKTLERKIG